jgi:hypothetical protein
MISVRISEDALQDLNDGGIASLLHIGCLCPAAPHHERSAEGLHDYA